MAHPGGLAGALALGALSSGLLGSAERPPQIVNVEPPSWWVGHSIDPVRLMLRGTNLRDAHLQASPPGLHLGSVQVNAAGTSLFADVRIDASAATGPRRIRVETIAGTAEARFDVLPPLPRQGRFQGFSPDDVIYLLMPDRFANGDPSNDDPPASRGLLDRAKPRAYHGGDLQGVIDRLPYLKDLGVTAIWMTPIYDNADRPNERQKVAGEAVTDYHGYGAVDFYAVDEHLGDLGTLRHLVDQAHGLGLKVIQDQVANHTGPYHPWVLDPPKAGWFHGTPQKHLVNEWQTWTLVDPYATPEIRRQTLEGWFADVLPDLDQDDPEVARYLVQNALWWVGNTGLDGIRQDTLPYVPRRFWRDWTAAIKREYPALTVVGEAWDERPAVVSFWQGGASRMDGIDTGIDSLFDFPLMAALRRAFGEGKPIRELAATLAHDRLYPRPDLLVTFFGNHDVPRFMSGPIATAEGLKLAFTFLMTARGIPLVYYGDEIALRGGGDPDNRRDFPGGWRDDARHAFEPAGRTAEEHAVFERVRRLTQLRKELAPLRRGSTLNLHVGEQTYAFARIADGRSAVVAINNGPQPAELQFALGPVAWADGIVLRDRLDVAPDARVEAGRLRLTLPARAASLYAYGYEAR